MITLSPMSQVYRWLCAGLSTVAILMLVTLISLSSHWIGKRTAAIGNRVPSPAFHVGSQVPRGVVVHSREGGETLAGLLAGAPAIVIVFSVGCRSCAAEAKIWKELQEGSDHRFVGLLAAGGSASFLEQLENAERVVGIDMWMIDSEGRKLLNAQLLPTIMIVNSDLTIREVLSGESATLTLRRHLNLESPVVSIYE